MNSKANVYAFTRAQNFYLNEHSMNSQLTSSGSGAYFIVKSCPSIEILFFPLIESTIYLGSNENLFNTSILASCVSKVINALPEKCLFSLMHSFFISYIFCSKIAMFFSTKSTYSFLKSSLFLVNISYFFSISFSIASSISLISFVL